MQRTITMAAVALICVSASATMAATPGEIEEWLQAHNTHRSLHDVDPLTWSATVAASAQAYADTCPTSHSGSGYGENLAWASYDQGRTAAVDAWYSEEPLYDYANPGFTSGTGHFTQVVWKGTRQIGCGYRSGCSGVFTNVWVCQYDPPGNYLGQFDENVLPPAAALTLGKVLVPQLQLLWF